MAKFFPKGHFPEGYFAPGYFPDDVGEGIPAEDEGGSWWWPPHLQEAFGLKPPEPPPVEIPASIVGTGIGVLRRLTGKAFGTVELPTFEAVGSAVLPALSARAFATIGVTALARANLAPLTGAAIATHGQSSVGKAIVAPLAGFATGQVGYAARASGSLPVLQASGVAEYRACTEEEVLELVATASMALEVPVQVEVPSGITREELEDLLMVVAAARESFERVGV